MKNKVLSERYAQGFLIFSQEKIGVPKMLEELKTLKTALHGSPDLKKFLESPSIAGLEKIKFVKNAFKKGFSENLINFLCFLIQKRRIDLLGEIIEYLLHHSRQEQMTAVLKVSSPLDMEVLQSAKKKIENKLARQVKLFVHLDAELMGGFQVIAGNTLMDGSIRGSLAELKEKLLQAKVS